MEFQDLLQILNGTHQQLLAGAAQSVNKMLTLRNWLYGYYIVEFEQNGKDRAAYGVRLFETLAGELKKQKIKGMSPTNLRLFRQFYLTYPQISETIHKQLQDTDYQLIVIQQMPSVELEVTQSSYTLSGEVLIQRLSYSHFVELTRIDNPLKRSFYEIQCIKGNWSVTQLRRQIESLLFERTGLSTNKEIMVQKIHEQWHTLTIEDIIRDPYILEFTGLKEQPEYSENELESALLAHLQSFLLELGTGFCFEARQKRIQVDNETDKIDLVFYHRILKCHILIDLKVRAFSYNDVGQMNFYLNYFKENEAMQDDNPPIGLILCTEKGNAKVKYATAGLDAQIFVSKYQVALPTETELEQFLAKDYSYIQSLIKKTL